MAFNVFFSAQKIAAYKCEMLNAAKNESATEYEPLSRRVDQKVMTKFGRFIASKGDDVMGPLIVTYLATQMAGIFLGVISVPLAFIPLGAGIVMAGTIIPLIISNIAFDITETRVLEKFKKFHDEKILPIKNGQDVSLLANPSFKTGSPLKAKFDHQSQNDAIQPVSKPTLGVKPAQPKAP